MEHLIRVGMDTSKRIFQVHGVDASEHPSLRKKLSRDGMVSMFKAMPPTVIGIEACGSSHHWARTLSALGHEVRLIAPQLARPYVKRGKNDAADAEAPCEAMSRPTMRSVPCMGGHIRQDGDDDFRVDLVRSAKCRLRHAGRQRDPIDRGALVAFHGR